MKKLLIFAVLIASTIFYSCDSSSSSASETPEINSSGFTEGGSISLSSLSAYTMPSFDTWIISDATADATTFAGLSAALYTLSTNGSGRQISLEFPNLSEFPYHALLGQEIDEDDDDEEYDYTEYNTSALVSVSAAVADNIGGYAFERCFNLTTIDFPMVECVEGSAFLYCSSLPSLSSEQFPLLTTIEQGSFRLCSSIVSVDLPELTTIGYEAFSMCSSLVDFKAESAVYLGAWAFSGCSLLSSVDTPAVTVVDIAAFYACYSITELYLPEVTYLAKWAFYSCTALESVELPEASFIGNQSFYSCNALQSLELPSATELVSGAFYSCTALEYLGVPNVSVVGSDALRNCPALAELVLATDVQLERVDANALFDTDSSTIALVTGSLNSGYVSDNTLTISSFSEEFASIDVI